MNNKLINYEAIKIIDNRKRFAVRKAEENFKKASTSIAFLNAFRQKNTIIPEISKRKINSLDYSDLTQKFNDCNQIVVDELKKINLTIQDISPIYFCKNCDDSGSFNGAKCECYLKIVEQLQKRELKSNNSNNIGLDFVNFDIIKDEQKESYIKLLSQLKLFVKKYPNNTQKYLIFSGATGTGKTHLAESVLFDIEKKGFDVLSLSSFALNNAFLKHHTCFDESAVNILDPIIACDALLIDDLGTEPQFNNVTNEYLISIINERNKYGKFTLITTNLTPLAIEKQYTPRIASRLFDSENSKNIQFNFEDLRFRKNKI